MSAVCEATRPDLGRITGLELVPRRRSTKYYNASAGEAVHSARITQGWDRQVLARRLGISRVRLKGIEVGLHIPSTDEALALADRLSLDPKTLLQQIAARRAEGKAASRRVQSGEGHYRARLTWANVVHIRSNPEHLKVVALARQFGVAHSTISDILRGKNWKQEPSR